MEKRYLLPQQGNLYKANLHSHTTLSDGKMTPEESKAAHVKQGYAILAITDHNRYAWHKQLDDDGFLAIAACEINIDECDDCDSLPFGFDRMKTYHINLWDTRPETRPEGFTLPRPQVAYTDMDGINKWLAEMAEQGFLCCYNHPFWSLQSALDYTGLKHLHSMEIYNHGCELDGFYGYGVQCYDEMLRSGQDLFCVSTDDNHNHIPLDDPFSDSFGGFTVIKAPSLAYGDVMEALKNGNFYASTGPSINSLVLEGDVLTVVCSQVDRIRVTTMGRKCYLKTAPSSRNPLTGAQFTLDGKAGYVRVECIDAAGYTAFSNAYKV